MSDPTDAEISAALFAALTPPGWEWPDIEPWIRRAARRLEVRSAAPELLEAVTGLLPHLETYMKMSGSSDWAIAEATKTARAAIKAALEPSSRSR